MVKILVVDDDNELREVVKVLLIKQGYEVTEAENGAECFRILEVAHPDLILLDVRMPQEDGWEICKKIKSDSKTKNIPVVMFTVCVSPDAERKSFEYAHADAHLNKPFETEELTGIIQKLIKR